MPAEGVYQLGQVASEDLNAISELRIMKNVDQAARRLAHTQIEKHFSIDSLKPIAAMKKRRRKS